VNDNYHPLSELVQPMKSHWNLYIWVNSQKIEFVLSRECVFLKHHLYFKKIDMYSLSEKKKRNTNLTSHCGSARPKSPSKASLKAQAWDIEAWAVYRPGSAGLIIRKNEYYIYKMITKINQSHGGKKEQSSVLFDGKVSFAVGFFRVGSTFRVLQFFHMSVFFSGQRLE